MKKLIKSLTVVLLVGALLAGCSAPSEADKTMSAQNTAKKEQSAKMMKAIPTPSFNYSVERENIAKRLKVTNDPNLLQWIYPMSAGRVIGRFPVRGKVTSGSKRLTSTQMRQTFDDSGTYSYEMVEAPDEMGTYGSSGDYVFWFDPSGNYHQHRGDYFLSTEPYQLDKGNGTISVDIDQTEKAKVSQYDSQSKANGGK